MTSLYASCEVPMNAIAMNRSPSNPKPVRHPRSIPTSLHD